MPGHSPEGEEPQPALDTPQDHYTWIDKDCMRDQDVIGHGDALTNHQLEAQLPNGEWNNHTPPTDTTGTSSTLPGRQPFDIYSLIGGHSLDSQAIMSDEDECDDGEGQTSPELRKPHQRPMTQRPLALIYSS